MPAEDRAARVTACGRFRSNTDFWQAPSSVLVGSTTMWRVVALHQIRTAENFGRIVSGDTGIGAGWHLLTFTGPNRINGRIVDGGGTARDATVNFPSDGDLIGQTMVFGFAWDGSTLVGELLGVGTDSASGSGYTAGGNDLAIGDRSGGGASQASDSFAVAALLGSDSASLTAGQLNTLLAEIEDNMKHGRRLDVGLSAAPESYYDARDIDFVAGEWPDHLGAGPALNQNGNPELLSVPGRVL